jgi:hypothetical protein
MKRVGMIGFAGAIALAGCGGGTTFGSVPFALILPSGEVLKGSASTQVYKGTFYATNGRVTCSGPFNPGIRSDAIDVLATCSDAQRGEGTGQQTGSGSGEGTIRLSGGKTATFVFGEAARAR